MNPLSEKHLQPSIHLSDVHVDTATLKTKTIKSLKELGPQADNESDIDVRAAATMCQYAYFKLSPGNSPKADLIDGWMPLLNDSEIDKLIVPGFHMKLQNKSNGFSSMFFKKQADGIQYYAYCTVGTDELIDWVSNGTQFVSGLATQYTYSVQLAKQIDSAIGDKAILWFIGHSLGGGLASNNSLATGRHAITFNAAGLNPLRVNATLILNNGKDLFHPIKRTKRIHAFVIEGEILNSFLRHFGQSAYGDKHVIDFKRDEVGTMERHALTTILDKWGMKHD